MPYIFHLNRNPSILIRAITNDVVSAFVCINSYIMLIRESLILVVLFIFLIVVDPIISGFSLLFLGIPVMLYYYFYRKKLKSKGKISIFLQGEQIKTVNQSLGAIKETKILNKEHHFVTYFKNIVKNKEDIAFFANLVSQTPRLFLEVVALFSVAMISVSLILLGKTPATILPLISFAQFESSHVLLKICSLVLLLLSLTMVLTIF